MKKLVLLVVGLCLAVGLYAQTIDPKVGYTNGITWGMKKADVQKKLPNGGKFTKLDRTKSTSMYKDYNNKVTIYTAPTSDPTSNRGLNWWYFLDDKLFRIQEELKESESRDRKLKARYVGIRETTIDGRRYYWDRKVAKDGYVTQSINIFFIDDEKYAGCAEVQLYDRETLKKAVTYKLTEYDTTPQNIVSGLSELAEKLVQPSSAKPTYAFLALTSDDGNALVENYVTDALTEAMFNTGKIKIVERASIEKIMAEQKFQSSALVNENTAVEIGNLSGANYVCYGTVKDIGTQISLNVKVVEVSTAELCAIGRENVDKDAYLKDVGFANRGSAAAASASPSKKAAKTVVNNQWKVEKVRNDFDECTVYTFTLYVPGKEIYILVGLKQCDNAMYSMAVSGFKGLGGDIEVKGDSGNIISKKGNYGMWNYGYVGRWYKNGNNGDYYPICTPSGYSKLEKVETRWFFDLCLKNGALTIRDGDGDIAKFQTAGLEEKMAEVGLVPDDFYDAYDNENF